MEPRYGSLYFHGAQWYSLSLTYIKQFAKVDEAAEILKQMAKAGKKCFSLLQKQANKPLLIRLLSVGMLTLSKDGLVVCLPTSNNS